MNLLGNLRAKTICGACAHDFDSEFELWLKSNYVKIVDIKYGMSIQDDHHPDNEGVEDITVFTALILYY